MNGNEVTLQFSLDLRRVADGVSRMVEQFGRLDTAVTGGAREGQAALAKTDASTRKLSEGLQETTRSARALEGSTRSLDGSTVALAAHLATATATLRSLKGFMEQVLTTTMDLEKAQRTLQYATGDGAAAMAWVRRTSQELGLELMSTAQAYAKLAAATRGTRLEGRETQAIFKAVASAATVMGLSADETSSALLSITQMVSKGKVAAEELRGQLGERLPAALETSARALGVTTTQLDKMLEQGQVIASDFLPKFARELQRTLGDQTALAALGPTAQLGRLKTAFTDLLAAIGNAGPLQQASKDMGDLATSLKGAAENSVPRELGGYLANVIHLVKTLASVLWTCRHEVLGLAAAYGVFLGMKVVGSIVSTIQAKVADIAATMRQREEYIKNSVAQAGLTYQTNQSALAQVRQAQAMTASQLAMLGARTATGELTIAEAAQARQSLLTAQAELAKAEAVAAGGRTAGLASAATKALGGPLGWITLLLTVGVGAWVAWGGSAKSATAKALEAAEQAERSRQKYEGLTGDLRELNRVLKDSKASMDEKKRAQERLNTLAQQMLDIYPELDRYIRKESENYIVTTDALIKFNEHQIRQAKAKIATADATITLLQAEELRQKRLAEAFSPENASTDERALGEASAANARYARAERARVKAEELQKTVKKLREDLGGWQKELELLTAPVVRPPSGKDTDTDKQPKKVHRLTDAEVDAEIRALEAASMRRVTLEEQEAAEIEAIRADRDRKLAGYQEKLKAGNITQAHYDRFETAERTAAVERMTLVEEKYATERLKLQEELQSKLTASEEGGLARRYAAIEKTYADIRQQNAKLRLEGQAPFLTDEAILQAEDAAKAQARLDQVREDVRLLREEMSRLAQEKGRALTDFEKLEVLGRWKASGGTKATASDQVARQERVGGTGWEGAEEGGKEFAAKSLNTFQNWKNATLSVLGGVQDSFANFFESLTKSGMTWGQRFTALWKGISSTVVKAVAQMAAQWLVGKIAVAIFGDAQEKSAKAAQGQAIAQQQAAAAGIFAAHAGIPYVGPIIAAGLVALMNAVLVANAAAATATNTVKARAVGGLVTRPELTLLGEAGPELVAPEHDFKDWASGLVLMGSNLQANLQFNQAQVQDYHLQAASYAARAQAQGALNQAEGRPFAGGMTHVDNRGAVFIGVDDRQWSDMVMRGFHKHEKRFS